MTDKNAIECAEALIQFCEGRDCECDGCVFRKKKHDGSGEWGCNIGEIVFRNVYDANEVRENYESIWTSGEIKDRIFEVKIDDSAIGNLNDAYQHLHIADGKLLVARKALTDDEVKRKTIEIMRSIISVIDGYVANMLCELDDTEEEGDDE